MTEAQWFACHEPDSMLVFLKGKATKRQLRLLGCACLRRVAHLLIDDRARDAVAIAERFADELASEAELKKARTVANRAKYPELNESGLGNAGYYLHCMVTEIARLDRAFRPAIVCDFAGSTVREADGNPRNEYAAQTALVRDIFGNPSAPSPSPIRGVLTPRLCSLVRCTTHASSARCRFWRTHFKTPDATTTTC